MPSYFAGIDIGTTSTKVVLVNDEGRPVHRVSRGYALHTPAPGRVEQDADEIVEAVVEAMAEAAGRLGPGDAIEAAAFSSAMHSVLLLDAHGRQQTPLITWADTRSAAEARALRDTDAGVAIYRATGTPVHPMTPLCKLMWMRARHPEWLERAARVVSIKEYVFLRMFGELVIDHSIASATGLFDIHERAWYGPALERAGVSPEQLSPPVPAGYRLPFLAQAMQARSGLGASIPFFVGASDGCLANLGVGAMQPGRAALTIGTSGAVRVATTRPVADPKRRLFTYILDDTHYIAGGSINNGGILVQWFRDRFAGLNDAGMDRLMAQAGALPAGSEGLVCIPYLLGERAPHWNDDDRGVFFGVQFQHTMAHFLRALMEGVALTLHQILRAIEEGYGRVDVILANGGFVQSPLWVQIIADVTGLPVEVRPVGEASAIGAALLAARASGTRTPAGAFDSGGPAAQRFVPAPEAHAVYRQAARLFADLYEVLHPKFGRLH